MGSSPRQHPNSDFRRGGAGVGRHVLVHRNCIALVLQRTDDSDPGRPPIEEGLSAFADFLRQNSACFWNSCLMRSVAALEYRGCLLPSTLLVSGSNFALEVVRSAWARRVLRPPKGYAIAKLGDVGTVEMRLVPQTQFAPLSEALCKVVADLNGDRVTATADRIRAALQEGFPEMQAPREDLLHKTLGGLVRERKIYHTGEGYFIVGPDTYRQRAAAVSPPLPTYERQMLMTNEEAIVRLHGQTHSLAVQVNETDIAAAWKSASFLHANSLQSTQVPSSPDLQLLERSRSLRVVRVKGRPKAPTESTQREGDSKIGHLDDLDANSIHKSEKQSVLAKILKRMQFLTDKSAKHVVFSAQFPPLEWLDDSTATMRGHSVATQTHQPSSFSPHKANTKPAVDCSQPTGPRIPWEETSPDKLGLYHKDYSPHYLVSPSLSSQGRRQQKDAGSSPRKISTLPTKQRYSPSHRYSHHGTYTNHHSKKRHKGHRRSSSESPRTQKTLLNGCPTTTSQLSNSSSRSRSNSEEKTTYRSSSSGSALTATSTQKPSEPEWARIKGYSKNDEQPSSSLEREVLRDLKNISALQQTAKIDNLSNDQKTPNTNTTTSSKKDETPPPQMDNDSTCSEKSVTCNSDQKAPKVPRIQPLVLKSFVDIPTPKQPTKVSPNKEILVDNSVSVEVALPSSPGRSSKGNNVSTTIVTEETTVTKSNGNQKVVTVTSITTTHASSHGGAPKESAPNDSKQPSDEDDKGFVLEEESDAIGKDREKPTVNDLNIETEKGARIIDCSSSCNIVTEVK